MRKGKIFIMKLIKTNINYLMKPYLLQDEELKDLVVNSNFENICSIEVKT